MSRAELIALYPNYGKFGTAPEGAQLVETKVHYGWWDLCYVSDKGINTYITTRPDPSEPNRKH